MPGVFTGAVGLVAEGVALKSKEKARKDFREYAQDAECHCCFPYWEYEGVSVLDVWRWWDETK